MTVVTTNKFISVHPEDLKFQFELEKQCHCDLKLGNSTDKHVAFKVKTTSPKKYFVRPNTGVIQPWDSCVITVTLQPQRESPPDMQCKDKFLLQSTQVAPHTDIDELPLDTVRIYLRNPSLAFLRHCRISNFIFSHLEISWILHIV
ncbi:hypothetical protein AgCh_038593 [Apium graveolens]